MALCRMHDIAKDYELGSQRIEVLRGISLDIVEGELAAIIGASGSGKTTLMNLIGCLDTPTTGRYFLDGREVSNLSDDELSHIRNTHIGFVFQSFYLIPYATVMENVLLPTFYAEHRNGDEEGRALHLLEMVGLTERKNFRPNQLSGGEQQRVAIARALINSPKLVLADEPTGQLDSKTAQGIMEILSRMNQEGHTVILITHDTSIAAYAQRIIRLVDGSIA